MVKNFVVVGKCHIIIFFNKVFFQSNIVLIPRIDDAHAKKKKKVAGAFSALRSENGILPFFFSPQKAHGHFFLLFGDFL